MPSVTDIRNIPRFDGSAEKHARYRPLQLFDALAFLCRQVDNTLRRIVALDLGRIEPLRKIDLVDDDNRRAILKLLQQLPLFFVQFLVPIQHQQYQVGIV